MNNKINRPMVFMDPWIDLDYYYTLLPVLPLIFERVYVYYPSDRWIATTQFLQPAEKKRFACELRYWVEQGIVVPVVKGEYPFHKDIGTVRNEMDGPTDDFLSWLRTERSKAEGRWIILDRHATERGRDSARTILQTHGGISLLENALRVELDRGAIPELAYYYAGGSAASIERAVLETIASYENDDWVREERELGEYLLPSTPAYQYSALRKLLGRDATRDVRHTSAVVDSVDLSYATGGRKARGGWLAREDIEQWRSMGLHVVLHDVCISEARAADSKGGSEEKAIEVAISRFRDSAPVQVAELLLEKKLLWTVLTAISGVAGIVEGGLIEGAIGSAAGVIVGRIGERAIRAGFRKLRWDRLIVMLTSTVGPGAGLVAQDFALGFGDVMVLGRTSA